MPVQTTAQKQNESRAVIHANEIPEQNAQSYTGVEDLHLQLHDSEQRLIEQPVAALAHHVVLQHEKKTRAFENLISKQ